DSSITDKTAFSVKVLQKATYTKLTGNSSVSAVTGPYDGDTKLSDVNDFVGLEEGTFKISVLDSSNNLSEKSIDITEDTTINDLLNGINELSGVTASYSGGKFSVAGDATVKDINFGSDDDTSNVKAVLRMGSTEMFDDGGTIKVKTESSDIVYRKTLKNMGLSEGVYNLTVNGKTFSFAETSTVEDIIAKVNGDSTADATMVYDETNSKIYVANDSTGALNLTFYGDNDLMAALGMDSFATEIGKKSEVQISYDNGTSVSKTITSNDNEISFNGNKLKLTGEDSGTWVNVTVENDIEGSYEKIKGIFDKYNDTMKFLYTRYTESKVSGKAETDMTEAEKQQGMLQKDDHLQEIMRSMKNIFYGTVSKDSGTKYGSLFEIGFATGDSGLNLDNTEKGYIKIDEDALKEKLRTNPQDVFELFSLDDEENKKYGIGTQMRNYMREVTKFGGYIDDLTGSEGSVTKQIRTDTSLMADQFALLNKKENAYYQKYANLEKAMSELQSQQSYITSYLGSSS
ncbi:MAG TPA: flagellar filament capping protein FliD, partial [Tepiditoga sp.]|nr:flagellar filament capping protein FliD [Tepiditoga sp.]